MLRPIAIALALVSAAEAEVVSASSARFKLYHEEVSTMPPEAVFERLMEPSEWWSSSHTYSGDAANLSMADDSGAEWREDWEGGSHVHGQLLQAIEGRSAVFSAPFGPLQETGAVCIWTIALDPHPKGTRIRATFTAEGPAAGELGELAGPVDEVVGEGIARLAGAE